MQIDVCAVAVCVAASQSCGVWHGRGEGVVGGGFDLVGWGLARLLTYPSMLMSLRSPPKYRAYRRLMGRP